MEANSNTGEYLPKYDVYIQYMQLPAAVSGSATLVRCEPVALINEDLSEQEKIRACAHEIRHIKDGDLGKDAPVSELER